MLTQSFTPNHTSSRARATRIVNVSSEISRNVRANPICDMARIAQSKPRRRGSSALFETLNYLGTQKRGIQ